MKSLVMLVIVALLTGCASVSDVRRANRDIRSEIRVKANYNECLIKQLDAKISCGLLLIDRVESPDFQAQMVQCIRKKGYPKGMKSCQ